MAKVTWKEPKSDGGAKVNGYRIVRSAAGEPNLKQDLSARKKAVSFAGLKPGTEYSFRVLAHNSRGWGKQSRPTSAIPLARSGFGEITGRCGVVGPQLSESTPSLFENVIDFGDDWFDPGDKEKLTEGGKVIFDSPNAGGSSLESEIIAYELLDRCEGAALVKTESEIVYDDPGKIVDLLIGVDGEQVGVSVVRLYSPNVMPQSDVTALISKGLEDINDASAKVSIADAWVKAVLVVMAYDDSYAEKAQVAWSSIASETRADTVVYLVTTDGADGSIYCNPDGPTCASF